MRSHAKLILAASAIALPCVTAPADAGILCLFQTKEAVVSWSLGFISGDNVSGLYATFAQGKKAADGVKTIDRPAEGKRPGWIYNVAAGNQWTLTSIDDIRRKIMFGPPLLPGATAMDFGATLTDADGAYPGLCEVGGPAA